MVLVIMCINVILILGFLWFILFFYRVEYLFNIKLQLFVFRMDVQVWIICGEEWAYSTFNYILFSSESCFNLRFLQFNHFSLVIMIDCSL